MPALLAAVFLLAASPAPATPPEASCMGCHAALLADKKPHLPAKDNGCATCHVVASGVGKCKSPLGSAWKLAATDQPSLCKKCHDVSGKTPLHPVIKSLGCVACHDPHASKNPTLLKIFPVEALCYKCHAKFDDAEFIHTAVKQGKCLGCHNPATAAQKPCPVEPSRNCTSCHMPRVGDGVSHTPFADHHIRARRGSSR